MEHHYRSDSAPAWRAGAQDPGFSVNHNGTILQQIERPTVEELAEFYGKPPWNLDIPFPTVLPAEAIGYIGSITMAGVRFDKEVK